MLFSGIETTSFQTGLRFAEMTFVVYFVSSSRYFPSSAHQSPAHFPTPEVRTAKVPLTRMRYGSDLPERSFAVRLRA